MMGTLLLAGCSAQKTGDAAETQAASAGSEHTITLSGSTASCGSAAVTVDGGTIRITGAGTYDITGTLNDGMVIVDAGDEDDVELVLNNASITSGSSAAIYIANCGDATITLASGSENALSNGGSFVNIDDKNIGGVIYSTEDLALRGEGSLTIVSPAGHGVVSKDDLTVESGTYSITAASHGVSGKDELVLSGGTFTIQAAGDGVHADNDEDDTLGNLTISGGEYTITAGDDGLHASGNTVISAGTVTISESYEGVEGRMITISGGAINVTAGDDGLNAVRLRPDEQRPRRARVRHDGLHLRRHDRRRGRLRHGREFLRRRGTGRHARLHRRAGGGQHDPADRRERQRAPHLGGRQGV